MAVETAETQHKTTDAERHGRALTTVEMIEPYRNALGSRWAPGDRAGFSAEEARDMIKRGVARPPQDKQVKGDSTRTK